MLNMNTIILLFVGIFVCTYGQYQPNWKSINSRPLPAWYNEAKFGIMVVWGVYSVPSWGNWSEFTYSPDAAWYWHRLEFPETDNSCTLNFHNKTYGMQTTYQDFVQDFTAELWDPNKMAQIIAYSGAKYMVITSKYHDGFCLWPSAQSWNWNSVNIGPLRDIVGELAAAVRNTDVKFGVYHSLYEWFNPIYLQDQSSGTPPRTHYYIDQVLMPQLKDLVNTYQPDLIWADGDWDQPSSYWESVDFLAWLYNDSPVKDVVVTNDRWGYDCRGKNGGYYTPYDGYDPGHIQTHKWEDSATIGTSYGYNRHEDIAIFSTATQLIQVFCMIVSTGGNLILGVGPSRDGQIPVLVQERLAEMGTWLQFNGEAIYSTNPWRIQNDTAAEDVWFSQVNTTQSVYAMFFNWPENGVLELKHPIPGEFTEVTLLGNSNTTQNLKWGYDGSVMTVNLPPFSPFLASQGAMVWALKLQNVL